MSPPNEAKEVFSLKRGRVRDFTITAGFLTQTSLSLLLTFVHCMECQVFLFTFFSDAIQRYQDQSLALSMSLERFNVLHIWVYLSPNRKWLLAIHVISSCKFGMMEHLYGKIPLSLLVHKFPLFFLISFRCNSISPALFPCEARSSQAFLFLHNIRCNPKSASIGKVPHLGFLHGVAYEELVDLFLNGICYFHYYLF